MLVLLENVASFQIENGWTTIRNVSKQTMHSFLRVVWILVKSLLAFQERLIFQFCSTRLHSWVSLSPFYFRWYSFKLFSLIWKTKCGCPHHHLVFVFLLRVEDYFAIVQFHGLRSRFSLAVLQSVVRSVISFICLLFNFRFASFLRFKPSLKEK